MEVIEKLPLILVEQGGKRNVMSVDDVRQMEVVWTIHCLFFQSAESLIREASSSASLGAIIRALDVPSMSLPDEPVVCELSASACF
jgi:hypothetical protein